MVGWVVAKELKVTKCWVGGVCGVGIGVVAVGLSWVGWVGWGPDPG